MKDIFTLRQPEFTCCMCFPTFQPGACVLDPMCGVGTILIEAAQEHPVRPEIYAALMCIWHKWLNCDSKALQSCE